jgi:Arc/MetJ family transcription regulator
MRTSIDIDDLLLRQAMRRSGNRTKKATVEAVAPACRDECADRNPSAQRKVRWEGDLNESRRGRFPK